MLEEKLDVLVVADVIDEDTKKYILKASDFFQNEMKINDETKVEVFLIHLAMAESRRRKNEVLDAKMEEIIILLNVKKFGVAYQIISVKKFIQRMN